VNKTHSVVERACGCIERRWLFGHDYIHVCKTHAQAFNALRQPRSWSMGSAGKSEER